MGMADHRKQRTILRYIINNPVGIEYLVPAMFGIGLRKHHQLGIARIALKAGEILQQVIDFVIGKRQPELAISLLKRRLAAGKNIDGNQRRRDMMIEQLIDASRIVQHRFRHPVMQQFHRPVPLRRTQASKTINHAALDAVQAIQTAQTGNIGRLGRPRADGADARNDNEQIIGGL